MRTRRYDVLPTQDQVRQYRRRRRLVIAVALAMGVLGLVLFLIESAMRTSVRQSRGHTSHNYGAVGFRAARDLLTNLGYTTRRWAHDPRMLPDPDGHVLIVLEPGRSIRAGERIVTPDDDAYADWVERGGRVVVALPVPESEWFLGLIELPVDLPQPGRPRDELEAAKQAVGRLVVGLPELTFLESGSSLRGQGPLSSREYSFHPLSKQERKSVQPYLATGLDEAAPRLRFFRTPDPGGPYRTLVSAAGGALVMHRTKGRGSVTVFATPYPWSNVGLRFGRTAPLVASVARLLAGGSEGGPERTVLFDEYTHGLSRITSTTELLFARRVLPVTLTVLLAAGLFLWFGLCRLGPPREERSVPRRAREEYVVSMAELYRRSGKRRLAIRQVLAGYEALMRRAAGRSAVADVAGRGSRASATFESIEQQIEAHPRLSENRLVTLARAAHQAFETDRMRIRGRRPALKGPSETRPKSKP